MEFKSLKTIETSFRQIRFFRNCIYLPVRGYNWLFALELVQLCRKATPENICAGRWKIVDAGPVAGPGTKTDRWKPGSMYAVFMSCSSPFRRIKMQLESNINRALFLVDKSAFRYYKDMEEKGYYNRVIAGNINQTIRIDSIGCNFDNYPYKVVTYARQMIIRESNITERSLTTRCDLLNTVRSDNNPHGFTMEHFEILENRDISVVER